MWRTSAILLVRVAAFVVACFGIDRLCIEPFRANFILREVALRSMAAQSLDARRAKELAHQNLSALIDTARAGKLDPAWYMLYGTNCEILGRWNEAAETYTNALRIDDRPEIYENRGLVMLQLGKPDRAVSDLATAVRFDPLILDQIEGELRVRVAAAVSSR
jgi:tetratricopeptide (TPR) repeat protein